MRQEPISCPHCGSLSIIARTWLDGLTVRTDLIDCYHCHFGDFFEERPSQIGRPPPDDQRSETLGSARDEPADVVSQTEGTKE